MTATLRYLSPSVFLSLAPCSLAVGKWIYTWRAVLCSSEHDRSSVEQSAKGIHHLWHNSCQFGRKEKGRGSSNSRQTCQQSTRNDFEQGQNVHGADAMTDSLSAEISLNNCDISIQDVQLECKCTKIVLWIFKGTVRNSVCGCTQNCMLLA